MAWPEFAQLISGLMDIETSRVRLIFAPPPETSPEIGEE